MRSLSIFFFNVIWVNWFYYLAVDHIYKSLTCRHWSSSTNNIYKWISPSGFESLRIKKGKNIQWKSEWKYHLYYVLYVAFINNYNSEKKKLTLQLYWCAVQNVAFIYLLLKNIFVSIEMFSGHKIWIILIEKIIILTPKEHWKICVTFLRRMGHIFWKIDTLAFDLHKLL